MPRAEPDPVPGAGRPGPHLRQANIAVAASSGSVDIPADWMKADEVLVDSILSYEKEFELKI